MVDSSVTFNFRRLMWIILPNLEAKHKPTSSVEALKKRIKNKIDADS